MAVKWKTVKNDFPKMEATIQSLNKKSINVGHLDGGENAWLAGIHEYGCVIQVTDKMRAWLHANGLHLNPNTTTITIPERSFLRAGFDEHHEEVLDVCERALGQALASGDSDGFLEMAGQLLRDKIVDYANNLNSPPKHPFSLQMNPGKTNPLIITGDMIEALTFEVK